MIRQILEVVSSEREKSCIVQKLRFRFLTNTGRFLGYYVKSSDTTHTTHSFFGRGNQVMRLLN